MSNTLKHIEALQAASLELESQLRASGQYSRDCNRVNDAITRGDKRGIALLWGREGKMEIVDLNGGSKHCAVKETDGNGVTVEHDFPTWTNEQRREESTRIMEEGAESYKQMGGTEWEKAAAHSYEPGNRTAGRFEPQSLAKNPTGDAARLAKENAAKEKAYRADAIARNERIFAAMKERSAQIHR
ncbi:hypothetical protein WOC76_13370 [Methylocystis sp. IM3]|uniref:hypothetical protein n=1 Tax=unclassified Methylocystis TaxID=2625913 RepID=UPI0030F5F748